MTIIPPLHFVPSATGIQVTVIPEVHVPICFPSGEQMDAPAVVHVPVDEEPVAGAAAVPEVEPEVEAPEEGAVAAGFDAAAGLEAPPAEELA